MSMQSGQQGVTFPGGVGDGGEGIQKLEPGRGERGVASQAPWERLHSQGLTKSRLSGCALQLRMKKAFGIKPEPRAGQVVSSCCPNHKVSVFIK